MSSDEIMQARIRNQYPNLIADKIVSVRPVPESSGAMFNVRKAKKPFILFRILCKVGIHKPVLIHDWLKGYCVICKHCNKDLEIILGSQP